jgi:hypothetical protein
MPPMIYVNELAQAMKFVGLRGMIAPRPNWIPPAAGPTRELA